MGSPQDWRMGKPGGQSQLHSDMLPTSNWILILSLADTEQRTQYSVQNISANTFKTNCRMSSWHNNTQELQKWEKPLSACFICITAGATHADQLHLYCPAPKFPKLPGNLSWYRGEGKRETGQGTQFCINMCTIFKVFTLVGEMCMFKWEGVHHHHPARLKRERVSIAHPFVAPKELYWRAILPMQGKSIKAPCISTVLVSPNGV